VGVIEWSGFEHVRRGRKMGEGLLWSAHAWDNIGEPMWVATTGSVARSAVGMVTH
jgi:hypothetical protein